MMLAIIAAEQRQLHVVAVAPQVELLAQRTEPSA